MMDSTQDGVNGTNDLFTSRYLYEYASKQCMYMYGTFDIITVEYVWNLESKGNTDYAIWGM